MLCCGCRSIHRDGGYESIASPRQGLDEARIFRRIAQCLANLVDSGVQVVVNINESVGATIASASLLELSPRPGGPAKC